MDQPSSNSSPNASPNTMVPRWAVGLAAGIAVLMFVGFIWQHNIAKMLASQNAQMTSSMQQTQSQLDALKAKIDAMNTPSPAPVQTAVVKPSPVHHSVHARHVQVIRRDDPRWNDAGSGSTRRRGRR